MGREDRWWLVGYGQWPLEKLRIESEKKIPASEGESSLLQHAMYGVRVTAGKNPCLDRAR